MSKNAAIFVLTQNNEVRRTYLKTCLYFLFKNFNAQFKYPVIIFHEGDYDQRSQREVLMGIREECRSCVSFAALDPDDFVVPPHIDQEKLEHCIEARPVPYWRNVKYRMMCRWWIVHMPRYAATYDYVMRLDDDSIIEEPITRDLFDWMDTSNHVYASVMLHIDCGICCYGMREFFEKHFPDKKEIIAKAFAKQEIPMRAVTFHPFRALLSITHHPNPPDISEKMQLDMPIMWYNNFHVTKTSFWLREDVQDTIKKIDEDGSIFYYRWGDAPLQTMLLNMYADPAHVQRVVFQYSKRMQREAFLGDDKEFHAYMPQSYALSSCITEQQGVPH